MPNKSQFVEMVAERLDGDKKRAAAAVDAVIETVYAAIARGEKVALTGFGVFERRERAARIARNPATGATVRVAASRVPAFRAGSEFKAVASGSAKKAAAKKGAAKKSASKSAAKKGAAKKAAPAKKAAAKKAAPAKKATAKKAPAKKSAAKKAPAKRR